MTTSHDPDFVPVARVAGELGVPVAWLRREADAGRIPAIRAGDRPLVHLEKTRAALARRAEGRPHLRYTAAEEREAIERAFDLARQQHANAEAIAKEQYGRDLDHGVLLDRVGILAELASFRPEMTPDDFDRFLRRCAVGRYESESGGEDLFDLLEVLTGIVKIEYLTTLQVLGSAFTEYETIEDREAADAS